MLTQDLLTNENMKIHFILHESFEAPAAIEIWAQLHHHEMSYTKLYLGDSFPTSADGFDFLIVMGGPQSPETTTQECPHFDAKAEITFIKSAIEADKLLLGVCLGAQLIGEALGAGFDHSPNREIGVFDVTLTDAAQTDLVFSTFPHTFPVGHWHGDMPGLTEQSEILAYSKGCPRQVVRYSPKIYGFQCHFEFTPEAIENMTTNCSDELEKYKDLPYIEDAVTLRSHDFSEINSKLFKFLDHFQELFESKKK